MTSALDWLRAHRRGEIKHDRNPVAIERVGRTLVVLMSTDAARIDGHRENIGARGQQLLAEALRGIMPTAIMLAERHRQATVKLTPITGDILHLTAEQHSELIDKKLLTGDYSSTAGPWIVGDVGKSWTIDRLSSPTVAIAEGFFLDGDAPHGSYGKTEVTGVLAVRVAGAPQVRAGRHGLHQGDGNAAKPKDYSQKYLDAADECWWFQMPLAQIDTSREDWWETGADDSLARVYQHPVDCVFVSPDGKPLPARHPGVELLEDSAEWKQILAEEEHPPDTEPGQHRLPAHHVRHRRKPVLTVPPEWFFRHRLYH